MVTYVHPSRRDQLPKERRRKQQPANNAGAKSFKKAHPVNELKSQIRSLRRLLDRNDSLPADVRVEKERALQAAQHELREAQQAQQRAEIIGRYHKIRFFDRQKAAKRLKRARKELEACGEGDERRMGLMRRVEDAQIDVNYARYYPLNRDYVSLFPRKKAKAEDSGEDDTGVEENEAVVERQGDAEMWERVKLCMADRTLDALRNGKLMLNPPKKERHKADEDAGSGPSRERKESAVHPSHEEPEDDEDSDNGFFE